MRLKVLKKVLEHVPRDSTVVDCEASPFILSVTLKDLGYNLIAVDVEPETYKRMLMTTEILSIGTSFFSLMR